MRMGADQRQALRALIEGDAAMVVEFWVAENLTPSQRVGLARTSSEINAAALDKAPGFLTSSLMFPYVGGLAFIQQITAVAGWEDVDEIWKNAPVSTEQILHPQRYPSDVPSLTSLPADFADQLGGDWREADRNTWGEFDLAMLLAEKLPDPMEAENGAEGWDGSEYVFLLNDDKRLFALELAWDNLEEAKEGHEVFVHWLGERGFIADGAARYGTETQAAALQLRRDRLFVCLGDDMAAVDKAVAIWER